MRLVAGGGLELLAELALASSARAAIPDARSSVAIRSRATVSAGSAPTTTATGPVVATRGRALLLEREHEPVEADPEPDAGCRPPAQQLDEPVVAAAAADRLLLALAAGDVVLERGPRVVVEAAHEPGLQAIRHVERVEVRPDAGEVRGARVAQAVGDARCGRR